MFMVFTGQLQIDFFELIRVLPKIRNCSIFLVEVDTYVWNSMFERIDDHCSLISFKMCIRSSKVELTIFHHFHFCCGLSPVVQHLHSHFVRAKQNQIFSVTEQWNVWNILNANVDYASRFSFRKSLNRLLWIRHRYNNNLHLSDYSLKIKWYNTWWLHFT